MHQSVLVIDDDEDDRVIIRQTLREVGCHFPVHSCPGGQEALKFLEQNIEALPTLIILDLNMPKMNGIEILKIIHKQYKDIPVIIHTTTCSDETVQKVKSLGAIDCARKGVTYSDNLEFAARIKKMLLSLRAQ